MAIWAQMAIDSICWDECFDECDECGVAASLTAMIQAATAKSATLLLQTLLPSLLVFSGAAVATWATMLLQAAIIRQVNLTIKKVMTRQLIA